MVEFLVVSIFFNLRYYSEFEDIEPDGDNDEDWLTDGMLPPLLPNDDMESDSDSDDRE